MKTFSTLLFSLCLFVSCQAQDKKEALKETLAEFNRETGITYKTVADRKLDLVLFLPKTESAQKRPVMLYTHGGGWSGGNVNNIVKPAFQGTLRKLLDEGVVCAAVQYRLTKGETTAVECVQDCKDAARFLVKNADKWNLDPDRLGVWGGSAGGHLALMTALAPDNLFPGNEDLRTVTPKFRCVVAYFPLTSFVREDLLQGSNFGAPDKLIPMLGGLAKDRPELAKKLSPVTYISAEMPPVLLIHGNRDTTLPLSQSEFFREESRKVSKAVSLLVVEGAGHSLKGKKTSPSVAKVNEEAASFILKHLLASPDKKAN